MARLVGTVAIVTGGATGLGAAIARRYAAEGAKVVIADVREDEATATVAMIGRSGGDAIFIRTDVTVGDEVEALVAACESHFGHLDVMTANAGILGPYGVPLSEVPDAAFAHVVSVNLMGVYHCFKYATPAIDRAGGGSMIATTSVAAHRGVPRLDAYCASKAAVAGLVRSLAADLAPRIRVNAVSPGTMRTAMAGHVFEAEAICPPATALQAIDAGRFPASDPFAVAWAYVFLASSESLLVTGHTLAVDGGRTVFDERPRASGTPES
jgi:3-oxoacyl-[acyl-carrier protein] reductase